jgi:hypothetical protein
MPAKMACFGQLPTVRLVTQLTAKKSEIASEENHRVLSQIDYFDTLDKLLT